MPEGVAIYVVQPGDTIDGVAANYGVNVETIIQDNQIVFPYALAVGQALFSDGGTRATDFFLRLYTGRNVGTATVTGTVDDKYGKGVWCGTNTHVDTI